VTARLQVPVISLLTMCFGPRPFWCKQTSGPPNSGRAALVLWQSRHHRSRGHICCRRSSQSFNTLAWRVSHETIYRSLYVQARGVLKKELMEHLRSRRPIRRSRHATAKADQRGRIPDAVSISERPASVEDRAVPGHWEGDLLCGSKNSYIVTLVERHSRYVMLAKVPNRETQTVVDALIRQARKLPDELYRSLTWYRGKELADHKRFSMETDIDVYFCDPQSPWQRAAQTKTPIACCASTSPRALISRRTPRPS
jgi:IS30 family transposase